MIQPLRLVVLALVLAACVKHNPGITGTQSLQVEVVSPTDTGSVTSRLPDTQRTVVINVTAIGPDDEMDTTYNNALQVYVLYLGTLSPYLGAAPLATIQMVDGAAMNQTVTLPPVFGPTSIWLDDGADSEPTYATGTSATLWYRDPVIADIQTPVNESALNALTDDPLENKNVAVNISRYGENGRLVVTSVYSQGFTLADVECADANATPPCVAHDYDYMDVFSYSAPQDQNSHFIDEGEIIDGFAGGINEFDGLTEIGFPQAFVNVGLDPNTPPIVNTAVEPAPVVIDTNQLSPTYWFGPVTDEAGHGTGPSAIGIEFERNESGAIELDGGVVCELDSNYTTYNQWEVDPAGIGGDCTSNKNIINVVTAGVVQLDPSNCVGKTLPKLVGILRPINIGSENIWIIYPRSANDITLPAGDATCTFTQ
jgi:hypothetical protein